MGLDLVGIVENIYRYPIKGFSGEMLDNVTLETDNVIPGDREYAFAKTGVAFDPDNPHYIRKTNFLALVKYEKLASLETKFSDFCLNKKVTFTLLLSNNKNIKKLNKFFRKKNKSTDILSFPLDKKIKIKKNTYLGDIIISYNYLDKPKSQDLKSFKEKVTKIFIHGFLHLLGFDHKKNKDYSKMLKEENLLFKSVQSKIN